MSKGAAIQIERLSFGFRGLPLFDDFSLSIPRGSFCSILGPSGCGKSTLVKLILGVLPPQSGSISILGHTASKARAERLFGVCPQAPALIPWLTVKANVEQGFRMWGEAPDTSRVDWALKAVDLSKWGARNPRELSGGMQARVALARAWVNPKAQVLVIDETLSSVDEQLREELMAVLRMLWESESKCVLFVSHLVSDAIAASTELVILKKAPHSGPIIPISLTEQQRKTQHQRKQTLLHRVVRDVLNGDAAEWNKKDYIEELREVSALEGHRALIDMVNENGVPTDLRYQVVPLLEALLRDDPRQWRTIPKLGDAEREQLKSKIKLLLLQKWEESSSEDKAIILFRICDTLKGDSEFSPFLDWIKGHQPVFVKRIREYISENSLLNHVIERVNRPEVTSSTRSLQLASLISSPPEEVSLGLVFLEEVERMDPVERPIALKPEIILFVRNVLQSRSGFQNSNS